MVLAQHDEPAGVQVRAAFKLALKPASADTQGVRTIVIRGPLALVLMIPILWVSIVTLDDKADRVARQGREIRELEAKKAPLIASQVAYAERELWRLERRLASDVAELDVGDELLAGHDVTIDTAGSSYVVSVDDFDLSVDYASGRVETTCDAPEKLGCRDGRWNFEELAGFEPRLLLP